LATDTPQDTANRRMRGRLMPDLRTAGSVVEEASAMVLSFRDVN